MITAEGLNQIATNFKSLVKEVLLNGTIGVEDFVLEEVTGQVYTLEFDVPNGVTNLARLEILDVDNQVIASNDLFLSIDQDARFKYILKFTSGR